MFAYSGNDFICNIVDGIRNSGVLGKRTVGIIGDSVFIRYDVFDYAAEFYRTEYFRFGLFRQVYALRIATAFDIKYTVVRPTVFVVADKSSGRICGKSGFAGA